MSDARWGAMRLGIGLQRLMRGSPVLAVLFVVNSCASGQAAVPSEPAVAVLPTPSVPPPVAVLTSAPPRDPFEGADLSPKPAVIPLSPNDEKARFLLPPGYHMEPVLSEPAIQQPASIAFDGNGRMFVLELRTYMLDADATNQLAPV